MVEAKILKNNIQLVCEKIPAARTCAIGFYFSTGSRYEDSDSRGVSHFTEHMLFKGTKKRTAKEISVFFDSMGAVLNAFTEREEVCLYSIVPAFENNISDALELLCDMSENCVFPEEEFIKEKKVVQSEISSLQDDAEESALDEVAAFVWKDSTLGQTIGGSVEEVEKITRNKLFSWYEKYFVHGELAVFVTGNFDENEITARLEKCSLRTAAARTGQKHFTEKSPWHSGLLFKKAAFSQNQIYALFPFDVDLEERESYALSVLNTICGDCVSSRLFDAIREKEGLCYNIFSYFIMYENAGVWCANLSADKKNVLKVVEMLLKELSSFIKNPFTEKEVETGKNHIIGEEMISAMDSEYVMRRNEKNFRLNIPLKNSSEIIDLIKSITCEEINRLASKIFDSGRRALVFYGSALSGRMKRTINLLNTSL